MRRTDGELIVYWTLPVLAVIWVSAFFLFPGFTHPMAPTMTARQVASFYRDPSNRAGVRYSMILFNWFGLGLIPMLSLIVMQVKRMAHRTPVLSYCLLGCAAGGPTVYLVADLFWLLAAFDPGRPAQLTLLFNDLAWMFFTTAVPFLIGQNLIIALAVFLDHGRDPVFGRWMAWFNVGIAACLVPAAFTGLAMSGPLAWNGLLSFWLKNAAIAVWIVVMTVALGRNIHRQRAADEAKAREAVPA